MNRMKGVAAGLVLAGTVMGGFSGCERSHGNSAHRAGAKEVRIALQPIPQFAPLYVAKEKGWLQEEFLRQGAIVKWSSFPANFPMNESFASGEQDIGLMGDAPAIIGRAAGMDTRIIGRTSSGPTALAVVVGKRARISSPRDLRGRKVATVKGSDAHHLLSIVLRSGGMTTDDIRLVDMSQDDIAAALEKGDIDAAAVREPLVTKLSDRGTARVLADGTGFKKGILVSVATKSFIDRNPGLVQKFLEVYERAREYIRGNPREAARLLSDEMNLPPAQLERVLARFDFDPRLSGDDIAEMKSSEEFMRAARIINERVDIAAFIFPASPFR
ncbi:MAG: aliphatic sulfonate ABC transporter substrate-binding protein [Actinomycetota bacterium]